MHKKESIVSLAAVAFTAIAGTLIYRAIPVQFKTGNKALTGGALLTASSLLVAYKTRSETLQKIAISTAGLGMLTMVDGFKINRANNNL